MMKMWIVAVGSLALAAYLLIASPAEAWTVATDVGTSGADESPTAVMVTVGGDRAVTITGDDAVKFCVKTDSQDGGASAKTCRMVKVVTSDDGKSPPRAWLGVALSETVGTADGGPQGVRVENVVKDSPAEKAGIQVGDIVVSINGEAAGNSIADVASRIGSLAAGQVVKVSVLRDGQPMELSATLAEGRPIQLEWLQTMPGTNLHDCLVQRGKVLRFGPDGKPIWQSLDDLQGLPDSLANLLGGLGSTTTLSVDGDKRSVQVSVTRDDGTIEIRQDNDGAITVRRQPAGASDFTEAQYATPEALRQADAEAADLYDQVRLNTVVEVNGPGNAWTIYPNLDVLQSEEQQKLLEEHMRTLDEAMKKLGNQKFDWSAMPKVDLLQLHGYGDRATTTIRVNPDGQIELNTRKGDTEVTQTYRNESDFQARNPEAYAKYHDALNRAQD